MRDPEQHTTREEAGHDRRGILRAGVGAAVAAGAVGMGGLTSPAAAHGRGHGHGHGHGRRHRVPPENISIQLFTLRELLRQDLDGTLAGLAEIGYRKVEHAGFVGRTAAQFRAALDRVGIRATSGHSGIPQPFDEGAWERTVEDALTVGQDFIVHPSGPRGADDRSSWARFAHDLNRAADIARDARIRVGYHNHQFEFARLNDTRRRGYDVLLDEIDRHRVHLEVDLFWSFRGCQDPVVLFEENRRHDFLQFHVKDMGQDAGMTDVGDGLVDFARIFDDAPHFHRIECIVERDDAGQGALTTARRSYEHLRELRF